MIMNEVRSGNADNDEAGHVLPISANTNERTIHNEGCYMCTTVTRLRKFAVSKALRGKYSNIAYVARGQV